MAEQPERAEFDVVSISQDADELQAIIKRMSSRWPSGQLPAVNERTWQLLSPSQEQYLSAVMELRGALQTLRMVKDALTD
jgi:hypothetical protein